MKRTIAITHTKAFRGNELLIGAATFGAAALAWSMLQGNEGVLLLWPGAAIPACLLIRAPRVRWSLACGCVMVASLLAAALAGHQSWRMAAVLAGLNAAEIALTVVTCRRILRYPCPNLSVGQAATMMALCGIAIPGLGALALGSLLPDRLAVAAGGGAEEWWSAHALGACLLGLPILLYSRAGIARLVRRRHLVWNVLIVIASVAGCYLAIRYARFPFVAMGLMLLLASFRLGGFGASLLSLVVGLLVIGLAAAALGNALAVITLLVTVIPSITAGLGSDARRRTDRALRSSEERYRLVVEDQSELISLSDVDGRLSFVNRAYAARAGLAPSDMIGTNLYTYLRAEDIEPLRRHFERVLRSDAPLATENWMVAGDGQPRWIEWTNRATRDASGRITGIHSVGRDVTDRRLAEQALRQSEQRLTVITDTFPGLISQLDADLRYVMANRRYADWFQVDPASLIGKSVLEFYGDTVFAGIEPALRRALNGEMVTTEREIVAGAAVRHCQVTLTPHRNDAGDVVGIFVIHTDISERRSVELALRASQSFLARTGAAAGVGGWELDLVSGQLTWSEEVRRLHEVDADFQPTLEDAIRFYSASSQELIRRAVNTGMERGAPWDLELELVSATGRQFWARATGTAEFENGKATRLIGAFQDITERRRLERELADSYERVRVTLESIGDAVITTDPKGRVQWMNPVAEAMTGWSKSEAQGRPLPDVCSVGRDPAVLVSRAGTEFAIEDSVSPIRDAAGQVLGSVVTLRDVTEQRRLSRELSHRAAHDSLTGLVNRAEFETRLTRLLANLTLDGTGHVLMYIDLDEFKLVNDACGHHAGDQLLRELSGLLQGCVRSRDTVARLGGDEFGVLLENCGIENGQRMAQLICDQMESYRFAYEGRRYRVGTSIGVVPVDIRWTSTAAVLQAADSCCYAAKDAGRNRVHLWVESDRALQVRQGEMQWVNRLEAALDENRFLLFAQHIEPIDGPGRGLHCEVLLRLQDDDGSVIPPGAFLPAAERFHLASRIDRWVLQRVFAHLEAADTEMEGIDTIAINLSGQSIGDRDFHRDLMRMIRGASFDVRKLCLEITETAAITRLADAKSFIDEVRSFGIRIALDDFGAGASSFGYLRMLPVDYLKIDGQFITGLLEDPLDNAAVRCFCEVARVIGVRTIAEFVEAPEVREALRVIGVDFAQGYLIHRAEPFPDLLPRVVRPDLMAAKG
jgi:diguanylate cyclase (GGDEF)-like protein/PAS domain S-box-containing protein